MQAVSSQPRSGVASPRANPFFSWRPVWGDPRRLHTPKAQNQDQPDLVERMVGLFFGKKALEDQTPFGLKRMSAEDTPELYTATTTEFAAPVKADTPEVATFRPLLAKTQLERKPLRLAAWSTHIKS